MPTERQAIEQLRSKVEFLRHRSERQAEEEIISLRLDYARTLVKAWDERNPDPPPYPAVISGD